MFRALEGKNDELRNLKNFSPVNSVDGVFDARDTVCSFAAKFGGKTVKVHKTRLLKS